MDSSLFPVYWIRESFITRPNWLTNQPAERESLITRPDRLTNQPAERESLITSPDRLTNPVWEDRRFFSKVAAGRHVQPINNVLAGHWRPFYGRECSISQRRTAGVNYFWWAWSKLGNGWGWFGSNRSKTEMGAQQIVPWLRIQRTTTDIDMEEIAQRLRLTLNKRLR